MRISDTAKVWKLHVGVKDTTTATSLLSRLLLYLLERAKFTEIPPLPASFLLNAIEHWHNIANARCMGARFAVQIAPWGWYDRQHQDNYCYENYRAHTGGFFSQIYEFLFIRQRSNIKSFSDIDKRLSDNRIFLLSERRFLGDFGIFQWLKVQ